MPAATPAIMRLWTGRRSSCSPGSPELPDQVGLVPALLSWLPWPALSAASASMLESDCDCVVFMPQACCALRARAIGKNPDSTPKPGPAGSGTFLMAALRIWRDDGWVDGQPQSPDASRCTDRQGSVRPALAPYRRRALARDGATPPPP